MKPNSKLWQWSYKYLYEFDTGLIWSVEKPKPKQLIEKYKLNCDTECITIWPVDDLDEKENT